MGNEAVARGVIEAGVPFAIGYPGTPSTEVVENLIQFSKEHKIRAEWAVNEKVAFDIATGISFGGARCIVTMKSAGLNVASDSILSIAYGDVIGGLVLYVADDPGAHAGMEEQDSRLFTSTCPIPMFDAYDPQSSKDMVKAAFDLSEKHKIPVILRSTSRVAHGKAPIVFSDVSMISQKEPIRKDISRFTRASPVWVKNQHKILIERIEKVRDEFEESPFNEVYIKASSKIGVIAAGAPWVYLQDVLTTMKSSASTLKLGTVHPLPYRTISKFLEKVDTVLILEELEPLIELQIKALAADLNKKVKIIGKLDGTLPRVGEYNYDLLRKTLSSLMNETSDRNNSALEAAQAEARALAPPRSLPFCPGCPHRGTYTALTMALRDLGYKEGDVIVTGDIGCTILGMYPPWSSCWMEVSMGASIANAIGLKYSGIKAPIIATIGDSTFFHAGIPPTVNVGWNNTPIVIAVLDNEITGMTGHQPSPASSYNPSDPNARKISIEQMLKASGIEKISTIDPYDIEVSRSAFKDAISYNGPSAVVLRRVCSLVARRRGELNPPVEVNEEACTGCLMCIKTLSCPAMTVKDGIMEVDEVTCTGCGMCLRICPSGAIEGGK
jgi:indolepyruvate ferredoxin oxidoreductase alpha subunit